jgi:hypothetical protein
MNEEGRKAGRQEKKNQMLDFLRLFYSCLPAFFIKI